MSTSNKTDSAAESTSRNVSNEITVEKDAGKDGTELMKLKESKFYELIDWLKKWGYKTKDTTKENKTEGIELSTNISTIALFVGVVYSILFGISEGFR